MLLKIGCQLDFCFGCIISFNDDWFFSTNLCVFTLPDQSSCNIWWVWHARQEMLTPHAPDLIFFWGFTLLHDLDIFFVFGLSLSLDFMVIYICLSDFKVCFLPDDISTLNVSISQTANMSVSCDTYITWCCYHQEYMLVVKTVYTFINTSFPFNSIGLLKQSTHTNFPWLTYWRN